MLNQVILVGRITTIKTIQEKNVNIKLAITRSYKNEVGIYETDFVNIKLKDNFANNVVNYCKVGDIIGVKGRIETINEKVVIVPEKITFLSSKGGEQ